MKAYMCNFYRAALAVLVIGASAAYAVAPTVSISSPANNATFAAPASITINATAADSDGTVSKVDFYNGTTKLGTDTTSPYSFAWANVAVGTYSITAKATDNSGAVTTSAAITVKVNANVAPTVSVTAPADNATFMAPAAITINATATDTDGTISKVEFFNGTTLLGSDTTSPYSYAWSNVAVGTYSITAKATDDKGAAKTSTAVSITVAANSPPSVSISAPVNNATFVAPAAITINANAADTDGTIAKVDFYNGTMLLGTDTTSPYSYAWANVAAGTYALTAKATDDKGAVTTSATVSVTVGTNQAPTVSITSPAANASFAAPAAITINATAADADGTVSKVDFYNGTTLLGSDTTSPYSYAWSNVAAGAYTITAKATDNKGAVTTSGAVSITVANNQLPTISFNEPIIDPNVDIYAPADITLGATASDPDGTITKVEFFKGATKLGEATSAPYRFVWANVATGTYSLTAKATDNKGAATTSAIKSLTVVTNANPATINFSMQGEAFHNKAVYTPTQMLTPSIFYYFPVSGGVPQRAQIYANTTLLCETTNATDLAAGRLACSGVTLAAGTYTVNAKVTGPNGAITSKTAGTIYVEAVPSISVVITKPVQGDKLWAGHMDIEGSLTLPAGATFKLYQNIYSCTDTQYDVELPATISGSRFNASYDWNPQGYPPSCLRAVATATDGKNAQGLVSGIAYLQASAVIVSPRNTTVYAPTIVVDVLANIPPNARVEINGVVAVLTGANYRATLPLTVGSNQISAAVMLGSSTLATTNTSVYVTYVAAIDRTLTVDSPIEGAKIYANNYDPNKTTLNVTGSMTGVAATSVIVRDTFGSMHIAELLNGNFTAIVPVGDQDNWLEVTAYGPGGAAAQKRVHFYITTSTTDAITLTSPTSCSAIPATPGNITLSALTRTAFAPARVSYFANTTLIGTSTTPPFDVQWNGVTAGVYQLTASVFRIGTTASGAPFDQAVAGSSAVKVTVGTPNTPPTCSLVSPQNAASYALGQSIPFEATATDADGAIAKIEFFDGTTLLSSATTSPYRYAWTTASTGAHTVTAKATDDRGTVTNCVTAQIQVSSNRAPSVSLIGPAPGTVIIERGGAIIEPGVGDIDGSVVKVQLWRGTTLLSEQTVSPFTFTLADLDAGTYTLFARAFDNLGASSDSNTITFQVNARPVVTITTPANGSVFTAPATIAISVNASDSDGTIQRVEIADGATVIATLTSPPYTFNWVNVPVGSHAITANAFDNLGTNLEPISRPRRDIIVNPPVSTGPIPTVSMISPETGSTYAAPALVMLQASASSANSTIVKLEYFANGAKIGESNVSPYKYAWINAPAGTHQLSARVTDALGVSAVTGNRAITVAATASISNVLFNGGTSTVIADDSVNITGKAILPVNAIVGVNGISASVDSQGNFFANNVLLVAGSNTIAVAINVFGAPSIVQNYTVTSTAVKDLILAASPTTAFAPASFTVTISNPSNVAIERVEIDGNGDGVTDITYTSANFTNGFATVAITLDVPGQTTVGVKAFAPTNLTAPFYTGTITLRAADPRDDALKIEAILGQFRAKLLANDATAAAQFFTNTIRVEYQSMLSELGTSMAEVAADLTAPAKISVNGSTARVWIVRQDGAKRSLFNVTFIKDGDGLWRIDSM
jgi:chitodextrinase